jgi:hypothetical protein
MLSTEDSGASGRLSLRIGRSSDHHSGYNTDKAVKVLPKIIPASDNARVRLMVWLPLHCMKLAE